MRHYCTYFDRNYLPKGLALIESLQKHDANFTLHVICLDEETRLVLNKLKPGGVNPVPVHDIEYEDTRLFAARSQRKRVEYYWTMTPTVILRTLEKLPEGCKLTYLDSDMYFFSSTDTLYEEIGSASVLIHRHNFSPRLKSLEVNGIYNVGMVCFCNDAEGRKILEWWREKCLEWCFDNIAQDKNGETVFGDQKYLERFHRLSDSIAVSEHPGVGVAPWNHTNFVLDIRPDGTPTVDGRDVVFYHFHSFQLLAPWVALPAIHSHYSCSLKTIKLFFIPYLEALQRAFDKIDSVLPLYKGGMSSYDALTTDTLVIVKNDLTPAFKNAGFVHSMPIAKKYTALLTQQLEEYTSLTGMPNFLLSNQDRATQQMIGRQQLMLSDKSEREQNKIFMKNIKSFIERCERWPSKVRLLNLGCGNHWHGAWLNVDITPQSPQVFRCDLRGHWPFPDNFFDAVYHSHILEHMDPREGEAFISQCHRVLKPNGILRVVVPDLESIAVNYLSALQDARQGKPGAGERHRWMLLELVDQISRHHSGGEMIEYLKQRPVPEINFVLQRIGTEARNIIHALGETPPMATLPALDPFQVGTFRLGGEVHRWMYDSFSLHQTLVKAGFTSPSSKNAVESDIPGYVTFELDADRNGVVRKPDSLFMEARKSL